MRHMPFECSSERRPPTQNRKHIFPCCMENQCNYHKFKCGYENRKQLITVFRGFLAQQPPFAIHPRPLFVPRLPSSHPHIFIRFPSFSTTATHPDPAPIQPNHSHNTSHTFFLLLVVYVNTIPGAPLFPLHKDNILIRMYSYCRRNDLIITM